MSVAAIALDRREAPGPHGRRLLGCLGAFRADPLRFMVDTAREYGPVARFRLGHIDTYLVSRPSGVKRVLQDNSENYGRRTHSYKVLRPTLGDGLVTSDGSFWRRQRRIAQPAFHKHRLEGFAAVMGEAAQQLVARWRPLADRAETVDIAPELARVTLGILGRALFSLELGGAADTVGKNLTVVLHHILHIVNSRLPLPPAIPTPTNLRFRAALRALDAVVMDAIERRRRDGLDRGDLLSMLMVTRDAETGEGMTDRQLRDEVMTMMMAGHETTTSALCWTLMRLSRHPDVRAAVEAEADEVLGGRPPTLADLPRLRCARMVLDESMRLHPPAWIVTRSVVADDEVDGFRIPAGAMVIVSPYVTHRMPDLWPNPEGFDPQRFNGAERPRYMYFPFGGGPHICIGASFALMEAQIVLVTLAQHLRLDLVSGHPIEPEPLVVMRPREGVRMVLRAR